MLIGLAIGGLATVDRYRDRPAGLAPPHEPSQALITTPALESDTATARPEQPASAPPPPPKIVNNETLAPPPRAAVAASATPEAAAKTGLAEPSTPVPGKAYLVQVGIFNSPANAQALQKQLRRAGIEAHLETRVQLGPFKDKRDADKALARARKLGVDAVLVSTH
jgi:DedD protein